MVEDTILSGKTAIKFVDNLRKYGAEVKDFFVLVDRQQGGQEALKKLDVKLYSGTDRDHLFSLEADPEEKRFLIPQQYMEIRNYFKDREEWHEKRGLTYFKS